MYFLCPPGAFESWGTRQSGYFGLVWVVFLCALLVAFTAHGSLRAVCDTQRKNDLVLISGLAAMVGCNSMLLRMCLQREHCFDIMKTPVLDW